MTPLETKADPNIRVGPLRWSRPQERGVRLSYARVPLAPLWPTVQTPIIKMRGFQNSCGTREVYTTIISAIDERY